MKAKTKLAILVIFNALILLTSFSGIGSLFSILVSLIFLIIDFALLLYFIRLKGQSLTKYIFTFGLIYLIFTIFYKPLAIYISDIWSIDNADIGIYPTYQHQIIGTILSWMRVLIPLNAFVISRINK